LSEHTSTTRPTEAGLKIHIKLRVSSVFGDIINEPRERGLKKKKKKKKRKKGEKKEEKKNRNTESHPCPNI
jgi:hypothetical protein